MADIRLLHWNIQKFSNEKVKAGKGLNGEALINYIAWVVAYSKPNIISIIEMTNSGVVNIVTRLIAAIDIANGAKDKPSRWKPIAIDSGHAHEAYVVLYQLGNNFEPLTEKGSRINGLTKVNLKGGELAFNYPDKDRGGRTPYYVAFKTNTDKLFNVIAYHAMYGTKTPVGVRNVGLLALNQKVLYQGVVLNLTASLTSGDFNIDFTPSDPGYYENLLKIPSQQATDQKTTLLKNSSPTPPLDPYEYRVNAYDNVFTYKAKDPLKTKNGTVGDLIKESATKPAGTGLLSKQIGAFVADSIENGKAIKHIPPRDFEDSWHIVRHAISDHLPVIASITI